MLENIGTFLGRQWQSGLEILILAGVIYSIYLYLRGTHGARILIGLAVVFLTRVKRTQLDRQAIDSIKKIVTHQALVHCA